MKTLCSTKSIKLIALILCYTFSIPIELKAYDSKKSTGTSAHEIVNSADTDTAGINAALKFYNESGYNDLDSVFILLKKAYHISQAVKYKQIQTAEALGITYGRFSDYKKSSEYLFEAYNLAQSADDKHALCGILNSIGQNYLMMYDFEKALEYFNKSHDLSYNYHSKFKALRDLSQVHIYIKDFPKAAEYLQEALNLAQSENDSARIAAVYNRFGELFYIKDEEEKSIEYLKKSIEINPPEDFYTKVSSMISIALNYSYINKYDEGIRIALQADSIIKKLNLKDRQMRIYRALANLYESKGDYKKANEYNIFYYELKDSLYKKEKIRHLNFLNIEFETAQRELQISALERETTLTRTLNIVYIIVACLAVLLLFYFVKNYKQKNRILSYEKRVLENEKAKEVVEKQQLKIESFEKDRKILSQILQINQQKEALLNIKKKLGRIINQNDLNEFSNSVAKLNSDITAKIGLCDDWNHIKLHFEKVHPGFFSSLKSDCSQLTPAELKLCAYSKLNLSTKEISRLLNINPDSVKIARYRLKKKLNIPAEISFDDFIEER